MFLEPLAASYFLLAQTTAGQPSWCSAPAVPRIEIKSSEGSIRKDFTKTSKDLEKFQTDTVNPYGKDKKTIVGGLTRGEIKVAQRVTMGGYQYGPSMCGWYDKISIDIRLEPLVYVARDYRPQTCRHRVIWEHEQKHVAVDRWIVQRYNAVYHQAILNAIRKQAVYGPVRTTDQDKLQQVMAETIRKVVANVTVQMEKERNERQQQVDTLAEYEAVRKKCKDDLNR